MSQSTLEIAVNTAKRNPKTVAVSVALTLAVMFVFPTQTLAYLLGVSTSIIGIFLIARPATAEPREPTYTHLVDGNGMTIPNGTKTQTRVVHREIPNPRRTPPTVPEREPKG